MKATEVDGSCCRELIQLPQLPALEYWFAYWAIRFQSNHRPAQFPCRRRSPKITASVRSTLPSTYHKLLFVPSIGALLEGTAASKLSNLWAVDSFAGQSTEVRTANKVTGCCGGNQLTAPIEASHGGYLSPRNTTTFAPARTNSEELSCVYGSHSFVRVGANFEPSPDIRTPPSGCRSHVWVNAASPS